MRRTTLLTLAALLLALPVLPASSAQSGRSCVGLSPPLAAEIVIPYEPIGRYEGHWGADYGAPADTTVRAAAAGRVVFVGMVVGNRTLTIDHGGGFKTSYSFLAETIVRRGSWVPRGQAIGVAGESDHGWLHFSTRLNGSYLDPEGLLGCRLAAPSAGLALLPPPG